MAKGINKVVRTCKQEISRGNGGEAIGVTA